eukprot:m51a1_g13514 hypothetical protein (127) ;mRNA; r:1480-2136
MYGSSNAVCRLLRSEQASEAFGIISCVAGGLGLLVCLCGGLAETNICPCGSAISKHSRIIGIIVKVLCIVAAVAAILAIIIWPATYEDVRNRHADKFPYDDDTKDWFGCQIAAACLAVIASVAAFF